MMPTHGSVPTIPMTGGRLVPSDAALALVSMHLSADACAGIARVVVEQRFRNPYSSPLAVTYTFPLPADGAVSGYSFRIGERRIVGEIARKEEARQRFEQALVEGRSAALLEQDRSSLFTQEIGNVPPGAEVIAELVIDQPLRWLEEGAWEWRFPTAAAPRYLGRAGRVEDGARVAIDVSEGQIRARATLAMRVRDTLATGRRPESPSHTLRYEPGAACAVSLDDAAALDRDVVVRWPVARPHVGLTLDVGRPSAGGLHEGAAYGVLTIVPPSPEGRIESLARDLIVLLDTSGSMVGEPLDQARRVVSALVGTLDDRDQLELVEFSSQARRWKPGALPATAKNRADALAWLASLRASGGTEMREGIYEALRTVRAESQRQVVLVTDGQIGFEREVIATIGARLPAGSRLHVVGVGSAVNRSLTGPAARVGRGVEVIMGLGEDVERASQRILARTNAPLVVDVDLGGSALLEHAPDRLPDLFLGAPVVLAVKLRAEGGELFVSGRTASGTWQERVTVPATPPGSGNPAAAALFGRELVEDFEVQAAGGTDRGSLEAAIENVGLAFSIATRLTSWVAVSEEPTVDPREPTRRVRIPQELPFGMSAEGVGLRAPQAVTFAGFAAPGRSMAPTLERTFVARSRQATFGPPPPAAAAAPPPRAMKPPAQPDTLRAPSPPKEDVGPRALRGRIVFAKDEEIVIEVTVDAKDLDWTPRDPLQVTFHDAAVVRATLVVERTTRAGAMAVGDTLRLTLRLDRAWTHALPRRVTFATASCTLAIEL
jgi:Ca-activated chloride channel homolog